MTPKGIRWLQTVGRIARDPRLERLPASLRADYLLTLKSFEMLIRGLDANNTWSPGCMTDLALFAFELNYVDFVGERQLSKGSCDFMRKICTEMRQRLANRVQGVGVSRLHS